MPKAVSMTIDVPGVEVWINYSTANLRITTVEWTIPSGISAWVRIWNSGNPAYNRTINGAASGSENVPGNHNLVEKTDPVAGTYLDIPDYLTYLINIETLG